MSRFFLLIGVFALSSLASLLWAQQADDESIGTVRPFREYEPTTIAVPAFGHDNSAPLGYDTMPRVIRRDLVLSGFFSMPANQDRVTALNVQDVREKTIRFDRWSELGAKHLLMADVKVPLSGVLRAALPT